MPTASFDWRYVFTNTPVKVKRCRQLKDADGIFQPVERCHWWHLLTSENMPPPCKDAAAVRSKLTLKITVKIGILQDSRSYTFTHSQHTITQQLSLEIGPICTPAHSFFACADLVST